MMNQNKLVVAIRANSSIIKAAITVMIPLSFALACTSTTAYAKKKRKVRYGQIEITTTPGAYPLIIDGRPEGSTSSTLQYGL